MDITSQKKRDLATFRKVTDKMIATSDQAYRKWERFERTAHTKDRETSTRGRRQAGEDGS